MAVMTGTITGGVVTLDPGCALPQWIDPAGTAGYCFPTPTNYTSAVPNYPGCQVYALRPSDVQTTACGILQVSPVTAGGATTFTIIAGGGAPGGQPAGWPAGQRARFFVAQPWSAAERQWLQNENIGASGGTWNNSTHAIGTDFGGRCDTVHSCDLWEKGGIPATLFIANDGYWAQAGQTYGGINNQGTPWFSGEHQPLGIQMQATPGAPCLATDGHIAWYRTGSSGYAGGDISGFYHLNPYGTSPGILPYGMGCGCAGPNAIFHSYWPSAPNAGSVGGNFVGGAPLLWFSNFKSGATIKPFSQWTQTLITQLPMFDGVAYGEGACFLTDDEYMYIHGAMNYNSNGPTDWGGLLALSRYPLIDLQQTPPNFMRGQWWTGSRWKNAFPVTSRPRQPPTHSSIGNLMPSPISSCWTYSGGAKRHSDGSWTFAMTDTFTPGSAGVGPGHISVRNVANLTDVMGYAWNIYLPPDDGNYGGQTYLSGQPPNQTTLHGLNFVAFIKVLPQQTWQNADRDDMCINYCPADPYGSNNTPLPAAVTYTPRFLQVGGL